MVFYVRLRDTKLNALIDGVLGPVMILLLVGSIVIMSLWAQEDQRRCYPPSQELRCLGVAAINGTELDECRVVSNKECLALNVTQEDCSVANSTACPPKFDRHLGQCEQGLAIGSTGYCRYEPKIVGMPCTDVCYSNNATHRCDGRGHCGHGNGVCAGNCRLQDCPEFEVNRDPIEKYDLPDEPFYVPRVRAHCEQDTMCRYFMPIMRPFGTFESPISGDHVPNEPLDCDITEGSYNGQKCAVAGDPNDPGVLPYAYFYNWFVYGYRPIEWRVFEFYEQMCRSAISNEWPLKPCLKVDTMPIMKALEKADFFSPRPNRINNQDVISFFADASREIGGCHFYFACSAEEGLDGMVLDPNSYFFNANA